MTLTDMTIKTSEFFYAKVGDMEAVNVNSIQRNNIQDNHTVLIEHIEGSATKVDNIMD